MIDYDVCLILEPLTLVGTSLGVAMNVYLTSAEIVVALVLVLAPTAYKTLSKGFDERRKDQQQDKALVDTAQAQAEEAPPDAKPLFPCAEIFSLLGNFAVHAALLFLAGGPTSIACGTLFQRSMLALLGLFHVVFSLFWRRRILKRYGGSSNSGGYTLDRTTTLLKPLLSCFAGVCAGGLGIAAGLVMGPIMLAWGLLPQASAATAIFTVLFTSSSTVLQYGILRRVAPFPSFIVWLVGFLGGLVGSIVVKRLMKTRGGKQWMIAVFLGILIVASGLFMLSISLATMAGLVPDAPQDGPICQVHNTSYPTTEWLVR